MKQSKFALRVFGFSIIAFAITSIGIKYKLHTYKDNSVHIDKQRAHIKGSINQQFFNRLRSVNTGTTLEISSIGGWHSFALNSAYKVRNNHINVMVSNYCLSACAAYILPATQKLTFLNNPIVGYHRNPILSAQLVRMHAKKNLEYCQYFAEKELLKFYEKTTINLGFWQHMIDYLVLLKPNIIYEKFKCPKIAPIYQNEFWLPTSVQLHGIIGLKFTGSVCADNFKKCVKKIDRHWKKGTRIVIGDEVYVSKGSN